MCMYICIYIYMCMYVFESKAIIIMIERNGQKLWAWKARGLGQGYVSGTWVGWEGHAREGPRKA